MHLLLYSLLIFSHIAHEPHRFYVIDGKTHLPLDSVVIDLLFTSDSSKVSLTTSHEGIAELPTSYTGSCHVQWHRTSNEYCTFFMTKGAQMNIKSSGSIDTLTMDKRFAHCEPLVRLEHIYYDAGKTDVPPQGYKALDKLVAIYKDNPNLMLEISGHSDCKGNTKSNMKSSLARAKDVQAFLISHGIPASHLTVVAYGDTHPRNDCDSKHRKNCTPEKLQENRRVEFRIVKF